MAGARRTPGKPVETASEFAMRDQEVVRATRELAAYFKGQRTEREARAALKIIKAFVRDREGADSRSRRPLPGLRAAGPSTSDGRALPAKRRKGRKARAAREAVPERAQEPKEAGLVNET